MAHTPLAPGLLSLESRVEKYLENHLETSKEKMRKAATRKSTKKTLQEYEKGRNREKRNWK